MGSSFDGDDDENVVRAYVEAHLESHLKMGQDAFERMSDLDMEGADRIRERIDSSHRSAVLS